MNSTINHVQDWLPLARHANWSVARLARLCKVSPRTLTRHFPKTHGMSPKAWLTEQRQKQAIDLLRDGTSVKEAASLLGYHHASSFAREFKKHSGRCPHTLALQIENRPSGAACPKKLEDVSKG